MGHVGIICPNVPGHLNPMAALADAIRTRGHRVTFFLLGDPPASIAAAGFEIEFPRHELPKQLEFVGPLRLRHE